MAGRSGHIAWGPWAFDYNVTDYEGLAVTHGSFRGISIFYKLSLPVIRVKYVIDGGIFSSGCGPYNDIIRWDPYNAGDVFEDIFSPDHHLVEIAGHGYVELQEIWGGQGLKLAVYARIGAYHLSQQFYFHRNGEIMPRLFSKGLSCNLDHAHHAYWRFDLDVDGIGNRLDYNTGTSSGTIVTEGGGTIANINHRWLMMNPNTSNSVWILPGATDTARADDFSRFDYYVRKYRALEDKEWWRKPKDDIAFSTHQPINPNSDVVFWYIAHLHHHAAEGADHWHEVGPVLQVHLHERDIPAHQIRRVSVRGSMDVVDYEDFGDDETSHQNFAPQFRDLSPDFRYAEFYFEERMGGEIRVEFRISLEWTNGRILVNYNTKLFEGTSENTTDLDGQHSGNYTLIDNTWQWRRFTVTNTAENDPDRATIEFRLDNVQRP